jgi:hypothetical protein
MITACTRQKQYGYAPSDRAELRSVSSSAGGIARASVVAHFFSTLQWEGKESNEDRESSLRGMAAFSAIAQGSIEVHETTRIPSFSLQSAT